MSRIIPYVNLAAQIGGERQEIMDRIEKVLFSGEHIGGTAVSEFEGDVSRYTGAAHCVSMNSGTDALLLSMLAMEIGSGDEIITQSNSYIASAAAIALVGAKPVFADVLEDQSIDPDDVKRKITSRTKAIMPVHLTGRIGEITRLVSIARKQNLRVIEDAAQSIGSTHNEKHAGTFGDVGCFSAHPLKNLNACGDAGYCITNDSSIAKSIRRLANHGLTKRGWAENWGTVSRLDPIQATILSYRLSKLELLLQTRIKNANIYRDMLSAKQVFLPETRPAYRDTFHTFVVQVDKRDDLIQFLSGHGIQTSIHYPHPIHLQPVGKKLGWQEGDLPNTEKQSKRIITFPVNQTLQASEIEFVAIKVNQFYASNRTDKS